MKSINRKLFYYSVLLIVLFTVYIPHLHAQEYLRMSLNEGWAFRISGENEWLPAEVPGTLHTDLMRLGRMPDPYTLNYEQAVQPWSEKGVTYRCAISLPTQVMRYAALELVLEGIEGDAWLLLNGDTLLHPDNSFRTWRLPLKGKLRMGQNLLELVFPPALETAARLRTAAQPELPGEERVYVRKPQYQFGWDWGPRLVTVGLWKNVWLEARQGGRIGHVAVHTLAATDTLAEMVAQVQVTALEQPQRLRLYDQKRGLFLLDTLLQPQNGPRSFRIPFRIENPRLWWARGMGPQQFYDYEASLLLGQEMADVRRFRAGVRQVRLVQEPDAVGQSFYIELNGQPIFARGANFIPTDNFPHRTADSEYRNLLQLACDAHLNMLRVWGGGIYEKDLFYDLCDSLGILVWQDFMFACAMYPGDGAFMENVRQEAREQVRRIGAHPSVVLWCGNNENREGWFNWGWQKALNYSRNDSLRVWNDYMNLFENLLPAEVKAHSPGVPYWPSSPSIGWGHRESLQQGDAHYWGVWWGKEPFGVYVHKTGRFMSEYGFQGIPSLSTLYQFLPDTARYAFSSIMRAHQKHPTGFETIREYVLREYPEPGSLGAWSWLSQMVQAQGIRTAVEAHRAAMPRCMGSLYWQLNDCWPVTSWSSIDHYQKPKILHYVLQEAFADNAIAVTDSGSSFAVHVIHDSPEPLAGELRIRVLDFAGHVKYSQSSQVSLSPRSVYTCLRSSPRALLRKPSRYSRQVLLTELYSADTLVCRRFHYFAPTRSLKLPPGAYTQEIGPGYIEITAKSWLKDVYLEASVPGVVAGKQGFDMMPGEVIRIPVQGDPTCIGILDAGSMLEASKKKP